MFIRSENRDDYKIIYELVKTAFLTAKVSNGKEQDYVDELRSSSAYIPELALVAEENGKLVGHIMLTPTYISTEQGKSEILLVAPLAVALEYRSRGIGAALVNESFRLARQMSYKSVILVGDPAYYSRFGFRPSAVWNIKNTQGIPDENVMACELVSGSLSGICGEISF